MSLPAGSFAQVLLALGTVIVIACGQPAPQVSSISADELAQRLESGAAPVILDVRTAEEYSAGHIPGALNIPHTEVAQRLDEIPGSRSGEVVVHCQSGRRAALAESILNEAGYTRVRDLEGHMQAWQERGFPVE